ncbi:MAG TPA: serine hydrolase domain-containing protein [Chitinophagales bacterium]|nr:serine hydrolase domain-containing protein [Chitinophagales bacterium]
MKRILLLFLAIAFDSAIIHAQQSGQNKTTIHDAVYDTQITQATRLINELKATENIPGISICVGWKHKTIWAEGFGLADIENHIPVTVETKFRIGSISKSLTGVGLAKLIEEKKIALDSPVSKYVNYWRDKKYPITIKQLANHTSGIRHYNFQRIEFLSREKYFSVKESIKQFSSDTLLFQPGSKYSYSTFGYVLLSAAMEGASGEDYLSFMSRRIFQPIGMKNTVPDYQDSIILNRARCYESKSGKPVNAYYVDNSGKWAGGGFLSTPIDLVMMCQSLLSHQILSEKNVQLLWTPNVLPSGENTGYGIGWRIAKDSMGRSIIHHGGQSVGARAFLIIYPDEELVIAITCNQSSNFNEVLAEKIADCFLKK